MRRTFDTRRVCIAEKTSKSRRKIKITIKASTRKQYRQPNPAFTRNLALRALHDWMFYCHTGPSVSEASLTLRASVASLRSNVNRPNPLPNLHLTLSLLATHPSTLGQQLLDGNFHFPAADLGVACKNEAKDAVAIDQHDLRQTIDQIIVEGL